MAMCVVKLVLRLSFLLVLTRAEPPPSNSTKPKPPPPPKPSPYPPPDGGGVSIVEVAVQEAKFYSAACAEYSRFGHAVASSGSLLAVGSASESAAATVEVFTVDISAQVKSRSETTNFGASTLEFLQPLVNVTWMQKQSVYPYRESSYYDGLGRTLALSADTLLMGAPYATTSEVFAAGAVYAFTLEADEEGTLQVSGDVQTLAANLSSAAVNMQFGSALAAQNCTLAVGAPGADFHGQLSGAVFVYSYNAQGSGWEEQSVLHDEDGGGVYAQFGASVVLSEEGTVLAVGACGYSKHVLHGGAVFVYVQVPLAVTYRANVRPLEGNVSVPEEEDDGGYTVGGGEEGDGDDGQDQEEPQQQQRYSWMLSGLIVPSTLQPYAFFGSSLAFRDNIALIGAYDTDGSGTVYLYERHARQSAADPTHLRGAWRFAAGRSSAPYLAAEETLGSAWGLVQKLSPLTAFCVNQFGASLAIFHTSDVSSALLSDAGIELADAYVAVVGAPGDEAAMDSGLPAGAVYLFMSASERDQAAEEGAASAWQLITKLSAQDHGAYDQYGSAVAVVGAHLLVGAELASTEVADRSGAVYVEANLLPYLVAAAQEGGGGGDDETAAGSDKGSTSSFWDFFATSGGIATLALLPVALIAGFVVANKKAKGERLVPKQLHCAGNGKGGDEPSQQLLGAAAPAGEEGAAQHTPNPTFLGRALDMLRAAHLPLLGRGPRSDHSPLPSADAGEEGAPAGADLRLGPEGQGKEAGALSIRSPITHIPMHASLVLSPRGGHQEGGLGASYRVAPSPGSSGSDKENLLPVPTPASTPTATATASMPSQGELAETVAELERLKGLLNKEFSQPNPQHLSQAQAPQQGRGRGAAGKVPTSAPPPTVRL